MGYISKKVEAYGQFVLVFYTSACPLPMGINNLFDIICLYLVLLFVLSFLRIGSQLVGSTEQKLLYIARASMFQDNHMNAFLYTGRVRSS